MKIKMEWISVKDRLPESKGWVYVYLKDYPYTQALKHDMDFFDKEFSDKGITHWMPLPEPPRE